MDVTAPKTREEFAALARSIAQEKGISLVMAVYDLMDRLDAMETVNPANPKLACCSGCSVCCYQGVSATKAEWLEIERYVIEHGILGRMRKHINSLLAKWDQYQTRNSAPRIQSQLDFAQDWIGKPCVFLNTTTGQCAIYPVRPVVCRTYTSTIRCSVSNVDGIKKYETSNVVVERYPWHRWADDFLLQIEGRGNASRATVVPLLWWVNYLKSFGRQQP